LVSCRLAPQEGSFVTRVPGCRHIRPFSREDVRASNAGPVARIKNRLESRLAGKIAPVRARRPHIRIVVVAKPSAGLRRGKLHNAILLFGIVNAALYSLLVPLWEGFDEAFHYGYVETLWQTRRLPILGRTLLPNDVNESLRLTPVSHVVHRWVPDATPFDAWFRLTSTQRAERRGEIDRLRAQGELSSRPEYEAHQPPLAYALLALVDFPDSNAAIVARVRVLRLCAGAVAVILVFAGTMELCQTLRVPEAYALAMVFTIFCSQMFYATVAHVANDWLAVGVSAAFFAALAGFARNPSQRSALVTAAWLTAGLLTKAYFLVFAAAAAGIALWTIAHRRIRVGQMVGAVALVVAVAGPWYARNVALYGSLAGTHEEFNGIGIRQAIAAAARIDWPATSAFLARGSIWTGNNSFTTYSRTTLDIMLALLAAGVVMWAMRRREIQPAERVAIGACLLFSVAVGYACCAAFADTQGEVAGASPWYTQVLLAPVLTVAYLGMSRWKRVGPVVAVCSVAVWAWVLLATWIIKLFPMYSGFGDGPMRVHDVWDWYGYGAAARALELSQTALAPAVVLYAGLVVSAGLAVGLSVAVVRGLISMRIGGPTSKVAFL
jgi:hypothetical protein